MDWRTRAACLHEGADLFFPGCVAGPEIDRAKQICGGCAVRARCLDWALSNGVISGICGGRTEEERREMHASRFRDVWEITETRVPARAAPGANVAPAGKS